MPETHVKTQGRPCTPDKQTRLVQGRSAAVHIPPPALGNEAAAMRRLLKFLTDCRWIHPGGDGRLNPYWAAQQLSKGWPAFRREFVRDLQGLAQVDPMVAGRVNASAFAEPCWHALKFRLKRWFVEVAPPGVKFSPRLVCEVYEKHFVDRSRPKVSMKKETWQVETPSAHRDGGWRSGATVREGTFHEVYSDLDVSESEKTRMFNEYDAVADEVDAAS